MKRAWIAILVLLFLSGLFSLSYAEDQRVIDKDFLSVSSYLVLSSVFDLETTFSAIKNGAHEANPLMKPFVKSGRPASYAFQLGLDGLMMFAAYEIKGSSNKSLSKTWWLIPSVAATGHMAAGGLNLRYAW